MFVIFFKQRRGFIMKYLPLLSLGSLFLILFAVSFSASGQTATAGTDQAIGQLQHNVYFYLHDDVTSDEKKQFEDGLKELVTIPTIHRYEIGTPAPTDERDVTDHSFGYSIFTWFESMEDYEAYDVHPDHLEFIERYNHLWSDVKVYDSDILDARTSDEPLFTSDIGVQMYSFRNVIPEIGLEATLDWIRDAGITEIEGGPGDDMTAEAFRRMCEERGLSIPSTGAGLQLLEDDPQTAVEQARALGSQYVMVSWIPHDVGNFNYEDARRAVEVFNTAGKILSEHDLTLTYHFHGYEMRPHEDGTLFEYIIHNTHPEYVFFQMDIFWVAFGGGDPAEILRTYGDRFKTMHLKDMQEGIEKDLTGLTDPEYNVPLGAGQLDLPAILRAAEEAGVEHYFIEDESSLVLEQIPESIEYLRSLSR